MIQELSRQLQDVLSTQDSVETAKVCRAIVEEGVRTICRKLGKEANPTAGLLELLSRPDVSGFVDDSEVSQGLEFVRILGGNAEHGRHIKKTHAQFAASACADFIDVLDAKLTGDKPPAKKAKDSEDATRRLYIDIYLGEAGWDVLDEKGLSLPEKAAIEIEIPGMPNPAGKGYADYVLYDKGGRPLAVVEAKKAGLDPIKGREQLRLYGELLAKQCGYVPVLYYSNGYETWVMDGIYPDRRVVAFHTADELQRIIQRRERGDITSIRINPAITGRPYQITAITKMCEKFNRKERAGLLVMATGTGKTRTVVSLVDVLSRNNWITNVLFLADRTSLVEQAHDAFREHLPDYTRSVLSDKNLLGSPNARIMFSTYQTMINKIDGKEKAFTSGRFDLIIVDEAHRSIFNKYRSICTYFDALLVGLTATPRGEVDKSTYSIFGCENDVPDYDYSMQQGFDDDFLRPYKVLNRRSLILNEGISYQKLTEDEKRQLDEAYDGEPPDEIAARSIFEKVFNIDTCNRVLDDLMANGRKVDGGDLLGKTIIFAYNHKHALLIVEQFNKRYPGKGNGKFCQLVDNTINYSDELIRKFKNDPEFRIAVSVDMLDTGVDVPSILNLVFFKPVRSHIKFVQMVGRGTRCCENVFGPGRHKDYFLIFDYCGNFEFFEEHPEEPEQKSALSVSQRIFATRVCALFELQKAKNRTTKFNVDYHAGLKDVLLKAVVSVKSRAHSIQVRESLRHIDNFTGIKDWEFVSEVQVKEIVRYIAPLVEAQDKDDVLVRMFDARMLRIELAILMTGGITQKVQADVNAVVGMANILLDKFSIPEVEALKDELLAVVESWYWSGDVSVEQIETTRRKLRGIMQFARDPHHQDDVYVDIGDEITDGGEVGGGIDIRTYRKKVLDYLAENFDLPVIRKVRGLVALDEDDLKEIEDILWKKLGTEADYAGENFPGSFVGFVRTLAGLDMKAVQERFAKYLSGGIFNSAQQEFVDAIIRYIRENGEISRTDIANSPQFMEEDPVALFGEKMPDLLQFISEIEKACPFAA